MKGRLLISNVQLQLYPKLLKIKLTHSISFRKYFKRNNLKTEYGDYFRIDVNYRMSKPDIGRRFRFEAISIELVMVQQPLKFSRLDLCSTCKLSRFAFLF